MFFLLIFQCTEYVQGSNRQNGRQVFFEKKPAGIFNKTPGFLMFCLKSLPVDFRNKVDFFLCPEYATASIAQRRRGVHLCVACLLLRGINTRHLRWLFRYSPQPQQHCAHRRTTHLNALCWFSLARMQHYRRGMHRGRSREIRAPAKSDEARAALSVRAESHAKRKKETHTRRRLYRARPLMNMQTEGELKNRSPRQTVCALRNKNTTPWPPAYISAATSGRALEMPIEKVCSRCSRRARHRRRLINYL